MTHPNTSPESSVLTRLRDLAPHRVLTLHEALHIAERQATLLLELQGIEAPPVPDETVTSLPRLEVRSDASLPDSMLGCGTWDRFRRSWIITVNAAGRHEQRRLTMLHEYKHILDYGSPGLAARRQTDIAALGAAPEELIADFFAACVLMPRGSLKTAWAEGRQNVVDLATAFGVPIRAMQTRLQDLGLSCPGLATDDAAVEHGYATDLGRRFQTPTAWSCPSAGDTGGAS